MAATSWKRTSASQIKTASLCPRKWWFEKLSGLPAKPPTAAMVLGTTIHTQVEAWLKHGTAPSDPRAKALADHFMPGSAKDGSPHQTLFSEVEVVIPTEGTDLPVPLLGFIDLVDSWAAPHNIELVDFKTLSDWQWAKTDEELATDLQMVAYARWAVDTYHPPAVTVSHHQVHKGTSKRGSASAMLRAGTVLKTWGDVIVPISNSMAEWSLKESATEVPAQPKACSAYGGCPFASLCDRGRPAGAPTPSPFANIGRINASAASPLSTSTATVHTGVSTMSKLADLLRARAGAQAATTPTPDTGAVTPPPPPPFAAVEAAPAPRAPKKADYTLAAAAIAHAAAGRGFVPAKEVRLLVGTVCGMERVAWGHVERAVELLPGATVDTTGVHFATKATKAAKAAEPAVVEVEVEAAPAVVEAAPAAAAPAAVTLSVPGTASVVQVPVAPAPAAQGYMLLVDIGVVHAPPGWELQTLEAYVAPIAAAFEKATGGSAFLRDFRVGERTVADMMAKALPADGTLLLVDSSSNIWKEASLPLVCGAVGVLRGTR